MNRSPHVLGIAFATAYPETADITVASTEFCSDLLQVGYLMMVAVEAMHRQNETEIDQVADRGHVVGLQSFSYTIVA